MSELLHDAEQVTPLTGDERWALVQRVASSRHLMKAPQLREILIYISHRFLADHALAISELEIGCKVLGRRNDFSPNEDNIVRVQIRHLRKKLDEYFATEGLEEPLIVSIPRGGYLPHFETRPERHAEIVVPISVEAPAATYTTVDSAIQPPPSKLKVNWLVVVVAVLLAVIVFLSFLLWKDREGARRTAGAEAAPAPREDAVWSKIFVPHRQTTVVIADTNLVMIQDILHADIPLSEYLEGGYPKKLIDGVPNKDLQAALRLISIRQYTSLGDVILSSKFMDLSRRYGADTNVRYARHLNVRDFKTGNFILIGSRRGIPWAQLFESQLNFNIEEDRSTHLYRLRNKSPQTGERAIYGVSSGGRANEYTYADMALLPNLSGTGYVLTLSGIDMPATEAAGELASQPGFGATITKLLNSRPGQAAAAYLEILLEAKATAGTGGGARIISYRLIDGPRPPA